MTPQQRVDLASELTMNAARMAGPTTCEPQWCDPLRCLSGAGVRYLVVGAFAVAYHGRPRATGSLDVWIDPTPESVQRAREALKAAGVPLEDVREQDRSGGGFVWRIGASEPRLHVLTSVKGVDFEEGWVSRLSGELNGAPVLFLSREALIRNKRMVDRARDRADLDGLEA